MQAETCLLGTLGQTPVAPLPPPDASFVRSQTTLLGDLLTAQHETLVVGRPAPLLLEISAGRLGPSDPDLVSRILGTLYYPSLGSSASARSLYLANIIESEPERARRGSRTTSRLETTQCSVDSTPPYASLIRTLIEQEKIGAARKLLATALAETAAEPALLRLQTALAPPKIKKSAATDADRSREYRWLARHGAQFRGKWVAVDGDDLLAEALSLKELRQKLQCFPVAKPPLIYRVD